MSIQDWAEELRVSSRMRSEARAAFELNEKKLARIRESRHAKIITYTDMQSPFDYVHELYPDVGIKHATVYKVSKALLNEVGYNGVGGFYDIHSRVIVISNWVSPVDGYNDRHEAEFTLDEVLCHELIHYAANFFRQPSLRSVEEEIAYGKSINYLRSKGRTDDFIIRKNMMPYLVTVINKPQIMCDLLHESYPTQIPELSAISIAAKVALVRQMSKKLEDAYFESAYKIGEKMITLYGDCKDVDTNTVAVEGKNLILEDD